MTKMVAVDEELLERASRKSGIRDETKLVQRGVELLCTQESDGSEKEFDFDAWIKEIAQIDFPELSDEEWEEWRNQSNKYAPPKW